jgi:hypothetical protein
MSYRYSKPLGDYVFDYILWVFGLVFVAFICFVGFGLVQAVRSEPAIFACESKNLQAVRQEFTTRVVCRPRNYGSDTLGVVR